MRRSSFSLSIVLLLLISCAANAIEVTDVGPRHCKHGIVSQEGSDFSLFLFCDDALGTQLGVIYTKPGVRPFERGTDWSNANRFWQEGAWMIDVNQLVWSTSGDYLYVATGMVYSDNRPASPHDRGSSPRNRPRLGGSGGNPNYPPGRPEPAPQLYS